MENKVKVILLLGGNQGEVALTFEMVRKLLQEKGDVGEVSALYRTASWGLEADDFLNQALIYYTDMPALALLDFILKIEADLGRNRDFSKNYSSRTIDIDILFYGNQIIKEDNLQVPHPQLPNRMFALAPLLEISPDLVHPVSGKTVRQLYSECEDQLNVERL